MNDPINPDHYKNSILPECIEFTKHLDFCLGNAFKYVYRAGRKGDRAEDLRKAQWYKEMYVLDAKDGWGAEVNPIAISYCKARLELLRGQDDRVPALIEILDLALKFRKGNKYATA